MIGLWLALGLFWAFGALACGDWPDGASKFGKISLLCVCCFWVMLWDVQGARR